MRKYQYNERLAEKGREYDAIITVSEAWVRRMYYPYWLERMKYTGDFEECLIDFQMVNWAWEI